MVLAVVLLLKYDNTNVTARKTIDDGIAKHNVKERFIKMTATDKKRVCSTHGKIFDGKPGSTAVFSVPPRLHTVRPRCPYKNRG